MDQMMKSTHFLSVKTSYSAEDYAKMYIKELVRLHGVLLSIIFYRDTQLIQRGLGTKVKLSTHFILKWIDKPKEQFKY